jgi:hypothetical protein
VVQRPLDFILDSCKHRIVPPKSTHRNEPMVIPDMDRDEFAEMLCHLGCKVGAEIGVEQGRFSEVLCRAIPRLRLYCVDSWARYSHYRDHVSQDKLDGFYRATEERLKLHDAILVRGYSADVVKQFKSCSLDFVYIDANHSLPYVINDIWLWGERVRPGGIISGHDFIQYKQESIQCHVVQAVGAWTEAYRINPWFVIGSPESNDRGHRAARSWFWVKEQP